MLAQSKGRPISKLSSSEQSEKERRFNVLLQETEYLLPRNHRYFCKPYKIDSDSNQVSLLLRDMDEYRQLLAGQAKKIMEYLHDYQLDSNLNMLLGSLLRYFENFASQSQRVATKLSKRGQLQGRKEGAPAQRCSECLRALSEYRVQMMREQLQLNRFEDHYGFFNVDHLNFQELGRLQRESKALLQGELAEESQFQYQGGCISLEQYQEVLNLLGSDLHQKNASIQKIIQYLSKTDKRLLGEENIKDRETDEEMKRFDAIVAGDSIKERLREIVRHFFKRYLKYKIYKRKDAETQANIKENDVIRQLQRDKKQLKGRIHILITEKERIITDYQNRLKLAQFQLQSTVTQFREQMEKAAAEAAQEAQKYSEERHLHDLHKLELQHLTNEYTQLLALMNRKSIVLKEKQSRSNSKGSKRESTRRSKNKEKVKHALKKQRSSFAQVPNDSDIDIQIESTKNLRKSKGKELKEGSNKKLGENTKVESNVSLRDSRKSGSYSKIDEKREEEEGEVVVAPKGPKRKTSRFKALMSHFNSNATIQPENSKPHIEKTVNNSINTIHQSNHQEVPQSRVDKSVIGKQSEESRYEMLFRLFQTERSNQQLTLPFPNFLQLYNDFITTIASEKLLRRSSSLKPRDNRLSSKYEKPHSRTTKSIDQQVQKENLKRADSKGKQQNRKSSKLEPIQRKSQYYLKKVTASKKHFDFKNYSRTAQQTLRTEHFVSIKQVANEKPNNTAFSDQDLYELYMGKESIYKFEKEVIKAETEPFSSAENQILMRIYAEMANLHIKNGKKYQQVKMVLSNPKQVLNRQPIISVKVQSLNQLKSAMKCIVKLHRQCKREKGKPQCLHLQRFATKINQLSSKNTSLKIVDNEATFMATK